MGWIVFLVTSCFLAGTSPVLADTVDLRDVLYEGKDYVEIWDGQSVTIHFDLNKNGFDKNQEIVSAALQLIFSSADRSKEKVEIYADTIDHDHLIAKRTFNLRKGRDATLNIDLSELGFEHLQDGLFDLIVLAPSSPRSGSHVPHRKDWAYTGLRKTYPSLAYRDNDIRLDQAVLIVSADSAAPVPEPATMLLLGSGLACMVAFRKVKKGRKSGQTD